MNLLTTVDFSPISNALSWAATAWVNQGIQLASASGDLITFFMYLWVAGAVISLIIYIINKFRN